MYYLRILIDFILHLNTHLLNLVNQIGNWSYLILFIIIFSETGLVILPILPGDALLFTAGYLTSISRLNIYYLSASLIIAAILGNSINYKIGRWLGPKAFRFPKSRWFNSAYLHKAHRFYRKYGGRAVIFARFVPIVRTFVPFVAGIASMDWHRFQCFNISSSITWVVLLLYLGYYFGNVSIIAHNFSLVIITIAVISMVLPLLKILKQKRDNI